MQTRISRPLLSILATAEVRPENLNVLLEKRIAQRKGGYRCFDDMPRRLMRATGLEIDFLRRRNGSILFEVNDRRLIYRERSRRDCILTIPQTMPETAALAAVGLLIEEVVDFGAVGTFLHGTVIDGLTESWEGSTTFVMRPMWETITQ